MASAVARRHKMVSATRGRGDIAIEAEVTRDGTAAPRPEMVGSVRIGSSCWLVIFREIRVSQSSRNTACGGGPNQTSAAHVQNQIRFEKVSSSLVLLVIAACAPYQNLSLYKVETSRRLDVDRVAQQLVVHFTAGGV